MAGRVASALTRQMARGIANPAGLGQYAGRTFNAARRTKANDLLRRHMGAHGAPHLTFELVSAPFEAEVQRLMAVALPQKASLTLLAICLKVLDFLIPLTPVDKGLARGTWVAARGRVASRAGRQHNQRAPLGAARHIDFRAMLYPSHKERAEISITNNLPYILPLEYGWSAQAPLGMLRPAIALARGLGPAEFAKLFRADWAEAMLRANRSLRVWTRRAKNKAKTILAAGVRS